MLSTALLTDQALVLLVERAASIGLGALVEVRDAADLVRALRAEARAVLLRRTPEAGPDDLHRLLAMIPDDVVRAVECGPAARASLIACARHGADAVLLGREALTGPNPGTALASLAALSAHPSMACRDR